MSTEADHGPVVAVLNGEVEGWPSIKIQTASVQMPITPALRRALRPMFGPQQGHRERARRLRQAARRGGES